MTTEEAHTKWKLTAFTMVIFASLAIFIGIKLIIFQNSASSFDWYGVWVGCSGSVVSLLFNIKYAFDGIEETPRGII